MKHILMIGICLMVTACIGAGENSRLTSNGSQHFPSLIGIDLQGNQRTLPDAFAGTYNIIAVGFEREHQTPINTWIPTIDALLEKDNRLRFYEVPVIYEMNALMRGWINNGMRSGIPDEIAREHTITVYTDRESFLSLMNMDAAHNYTLLVDQSGKILWSAKGAMTDKAIAELKTAIQSFS